METYNGNINEFVDWVTGKNSITGQSDTNNLPVSGKSIRELLQSKLKQPFYIYEDKANNKYRMFSSEDAYMIWKENPTDNIDLELFNFVRPSDYKLDLTAINSDGFNNKFVRYGDADSQGARIAFQWDIYNDEGQSSDSLSVTYTITNSSSGTSTSFTRWYNRSDANPDFSIYQYLQPGENTITIEGRGTTTGARNTKTFTISLLQINLTSTFDFCAKYSPNTPIQIQYVFDRNNNNGTAKIYFKIDDGGANKSNTKDVVQNGPTRITETQIMQANLSEGQHTLQIWAEAKYNDGNTTIHSNLLYYTFTVASSVIGSTNKFINIHRSFDTGNFPLSDLMLNATQYEPYTLQWGYYTDSLQTNTSIPVVWKLLNGDDDQNPLTIGNITANSQERATALSFIPAIYTQDETNTYVAAYFNNTLIKKIPIYIVKNTKVNVNETGFYEVKMSAYGKTNDSSSKDAWTDEAGNVTTTFTGIQWNTNSGWYNNSFRTIGTTEYANIDVNPFRNFNFVYGKTIEIEFESEKVSDENEQLIVIGNPNGARIEITADTATLYNNGNTDVIHTNYKSNERLKLAFIINPIQEDVQNRTVESGLVYIVNNGILERAAIASGQSFITEGGIKIGGASSGVRVYMIRVYNYAISYMDAYNNYLYDNENKATIALNNNILDVSGDISFDLCKNKLDTILISGDLSNILSGQTDKDDSTTDVTIERFCPFDSTKNFKINNAQIRKHGQSTLNYPITSMKFWLNKSKSGIIPTYESTQQSDLLLNKNRYVMKSATDSGKPSIPANKFVLQANYADSSGVHNGSLMRLMQKTWFNAQIDGEYKLRTEPQLFATNQIITHNDANLGENGWIEGRNEDGKQWKDVTSQEFPYDIRISPDSFPCAVFYYDEKGTKKRTFLGQYVFMEDKKSDYSYGERSIYSVPSDPFCLTNIHKDDDTKQNRVWNNKNVLRIEVVGSNVPFTSYMTHNGFTDIITIDELDTEGNPTGKQTRLYNWENAFEMVFPDEDDIAEDDAKAGMDKFNPNSNYVAKVQPFIDFHAWVTSTYKNQSKFQSEAAQHLDLYKMAAYYIFVLRFGLVDSLERNAQVKTYDGQHWHYEPWDMDIALGNKNDGGIAYNPPIDRNTKLPGSISTYAISGRSADVNTGEIVTSNWLWDALEAWPYWINTIVPKVADALFNAGLKYNEISSMFDNEYAAKWCEIMYNESGFFKYIESGKGDATWLSWLQGSRMTHRHWWLSNSMDYYDAKWFCGDYKSHYIYLRANVTEGSHEYVRITPNKDTYITVTKDGVSQGTQAVGPSVPLIFDMAIGSATKNPIYFYGANFMENIDLSDIAHGLDGITLDGVYSDVLGSPLKSLNVGVHITENNDQSIDAQYTATLAALGCQIQGNANVFQSLQKLNIRGQLNQTDLNGLIYNNNVSELQELYAMGSGLTNFYSSQFGNKFTTIELPDTVYTIWMNNSQWENMSFWHATVDSNNFAQLKYISSIPTTVHDVSLLGTTGSTRESILFVKNWIASLRAANVDFSQYTLTMDKMNWSETTVGANNLLTLEELEYLAQFNNARTLLKGYLVLKDTGSDLTSAELNTIKSWFGDTVFTKNSSGLVVDHRRQYVQINIGGNIIVDEQGNVSIEEGNAASLNATRFSLAEDDTTQYSWTIGPVNSNESYTRYKGLTVIQQEDSVDGIAYIQSTQSQEQQDYDVKVTCSVEGTNYSTILHVIAASYPSDLFIEIENKAMVAPRVIPGYTEFYISGQSARFFAKSNQQYSGVINKTTYTFTRLSDNKSVQYVDGGFSDQLSNLYDDYITISADNTSGVVISADTAMPSNEDLLMYRLDVEVLFKSGYRANASKSIVLGDDSSAIVMSSSLLYTPINNAWQSQFGSTIGRNNIYKIDLMVLTEEIDFSDIGSELPSMTTTNGSYLFKYLLNCTGIILDGCTQITSFNNSNINQMNFSNMTHLQKLSIQNCIGLTEDIDLTDNSEILEVDASGTTVNVLISDESALTKYELGTPTSINIVNPTVLTANGIYVDDCKEIESLTLKNIPNNNTFTSFGKVLNLYIGAFTFNKDVASAAPITSIQSVDGNFVSEIINIKGAEKLYVETDVPNLKYRVYAEDGSNIWDFDTINVDQTMTDSWILNRGIPAQTRLHGSIDNLDAGSKIIIKKKVGSDYVVLYEWRKINTVTNLNISQSSNVEIVSPEIIKALYDVSQTALSAQVSGNIQVRKANQNEADYLTGRFFNLFINVT